LLREKQDEEEGDQEGDKRDTTKAYHFRKLVCTRCPRKSRTCSEHLEQGLTARPPWPTRVSRRDKKPVGSGGSGRFLLYVEGSTNRS